MHSTEIDDSLLRGRLVRLAAMDAEAASAAFSRWSRDSGYYRLLDSEPSRPFSVKKSKEWIEKNQENEDGFSFLIRTLQDDRLIGEIGLGGLSWNHGEAFLGIGVGEREYWGKGYGTDAVRVLLRFGFTELNLHRISLDVFEYNERAIRSYEKAGFVHEGRERKFLNREGRRWDLIYMGILREEWEKTG